MPAADESPAIELVDCSVTFGSLQALNRVSLSVRRGEAVALLGPSGCGKTTLLRVISGAVEPEGERSVSGRTGVVYQDLKLLPWMTVAQNIALARSGGRSSESQEEINNLLRLAAIEEKAEVYPYLLSGGQRQRVAIVRALYGGAETLLLDEPFSALDFVARERLLEVIKKLRISTRATLIIVTHDFQDAMELADRLFIMRDGSVVGEFSRASIETAGSGPIREKILELYRGRKHAGPDQ